jgi:hypothetical protein
MGVEPDECQVLFETVGRHRRIGLWGVQILQAKSLDARRRNRLALIDASKGTGEYDASPSGNPLIRRER